MSATNSDFEWVGENRQLATEGPLGPCAETYIEEADDGSEHLVVHEHLNPYGWLASNEWTEVEQ